MDIIEENAAQVYTPDTATMRLLSMIYKKCAEHRDAIGYPVGSDSGPYFYVTNDLCGKFGMCLNTLFEAKVKLEPSWLVELARNYVGSYDDEQSGLYHSQSRQSAVEMLEKLEVHAAKSAA
jgi:hypothetical protein